MFDLTNSIDVFPQHSFIYSYFITLYYKFYLAMKKLKFLHYSALILGFIFSTEASHAQTKLWGVGATYGQAEGEFQTNFVQATTAGNYSTSQWTALSINENSGAVTPGSAFWTRSLTGRSQGGYAGSMPVASSPSQANGLAIFDSNFLDDNGTAGAGGTGTSPAHHKGELISPRIDLTGATDSALLVRFHSYNRLKSSADLSISFSVDDGTSWVKTYDIKTLQPAASSARIEGEVIALFPNVTAGIANLSQCRIKYTFDGRYYYAMIDDISIEMAPEYDLAIGLPDEDASTFFSIGNIVRIGNNAYNPLMNLDSNDLSEWLWGAKIVNNGWKTILPSDAPTIKCSIDYTNLTTNVQTTGVYLDTIIGGPNDSIRANDKNGIALVDYLREINFIMTHGAGRYDVKYWVEHNNPDGSSKNDTIEHYFIITDNTNSSSHYLSKARLANSDGRVYARGNILSGNGPHTAFEYGSVFYFPAGMTDNISIDSVDFRFYVPNNFSGNTTQTLFANVYHYVDGSNGGSANGALVGDELTQISIATLTLTDIGTTLSKGDYHLGTFKNFSDASTGGPVQPFVDGGFYYISVLTKPSVSGGVATFGYNDVVIHGVDRLNYAMNIGTRTSTVPVSPSAIKRVDATGAEFWFSGFSGYEEVPSIGVHISANPTVSNISTVLESENTILTLYPNPTDQRLNIDVEFDQPTDAQYIITDVSGRVVYLSKSAQVNAEVLTIDVSNLNTGVYFVTVETDTGVSTKRFVKQ